MATVVSPFPCSLAAGTLASAGGGAVGGGRAMTAGTEGSAAFVLGDLLAGSAVPESPEVGTPVVIASCSRLIVSEARANRFDRSCGLMIGCMTRVISKLSLLRLIT